MKYEIREQPGWKKIRKQKSEKENEKENERRKTYS